MTRMIAGADGGGGSGDCDGDGGVVRVMVTVVVFFLECENNEMTFFFLGHRVNIRSVSYLQDDQPESTRKTLAFSEAILSE
ncbi:hypothetical protein Tco_1485863 [Tanacetum coccineum]